MFEQSDGENKRDLPRDKETERADVDIIVSLPGGTTADGDGDGLWSI